MKKTKGFSQVFIVLVLALGLGIGVFLVQQKTNFLNFASGNFKQQPSSQYKRTPPRSTPSLPTMYQPKSVVTSSTPAKGFVKGMGGTYADTIPGACDWMKALDVSWYYDWGPNPRQCPGIEAVPMVPSTNIPTEVGGNSPYLMGFNEPDIQGTIDPATAAVLWKQIEDQFPSKKLVSPAVAWYNTDPNNPSKPVGLNWLTIWYETYKAKYQKTPRVDVFAIHCYENISPTSCTSDWLSQAINWATSHNINEVWVSEYGRLACKWQGDQLVRDSSSAITSMQTFTNWFQATGIITRYAWFDLTDYGNEIWSFGTTCNTSVYDINTGTITDLGLAYQKQASNLFGNIEVKAVTNTPVCASDQSCTIPLSNISFTLYRSLDNQVVVTELTNSTGTANFTGLLAGSYYIQYQTSSPSERNQVQSQRQDVTVVIGQTNSYTIFIDKGIR